MTKDNEIYNALDKFFDQEWVKFGDLLRKNGLWKNSSSKIVSRDIPLSNFSNKKL